MVALLDISGGLHQREPDSSMASLKVPTLQRVHSSRLDAQGRASLIRGEVLEALRRKIESGRVPESVALRFAHTLARSKVLATKLLTSADYLPKFRQALSSYLGSPPQKEVQGSHALTRALYSMRGPLSAMLRESPELLSPTGSAKYGQFSLARINNWLAGDKGDSLIRHQFKGYLLECNCPHKHVEVVTNAFLRNHRKSLVEYISAKKLLPEIEHLRFLKYGGRKSEWTHLRNKLVREGISEYATKVRESYKCSPV